MARKSVQYSETHAQYSKQADYQPPASSAHQPKKKSSPDFSGLSPDIAQLRQLSLDFGAEQSFALIHGGHSQHVAICQKANGEWLEKMVSHDEARFAVSAVSVAGAYDCYISQHGFTSRNRRISSVQALTSCAIDLDYYKIPALAGLSPLDIMDRSNADYPWLPEPSALYGSGQGTYIEWAFTQPLPAERLDEWQAVTDALVEILEPMGADWNARDAARVFRMIGSRNSKSGRYVVPVKTGPRIKFETVRCAALDGLAQVRQRREQPNPADSSGEPESSDTGQQRAATAAQRAQAIKPYELALARLIDYRTLARLRGNPKLNDYRHRMLFCVVVSVCWFVSNKQEAIAECEQFAADHFANPRKYTARRIGSVLERLEHKNMPRIWNGNRVANRYRLRNSTIIKMLDITPEEQRHMKTLIDGNEKRRRRVERRRAAGMVGRAEYLATAEQRRDAVLELRRQGMKQREIADATGLTLRHVQRILAARQGDLFE